MLALAAPIAILEFFPPASAGGYFSFFKPFLAQENNTMVLKRFVIIAAVLLPVALWAADEQPIPVSVKAPSDLQTIMAALPPEARPLGMRRAENGALYALLPNGC